MHRSIVKWIEHQPGNQKVPVWCFCCSFLEHETFLTLLQSTQLNNGDLVAWSSGEAAHPAVISMGTWCLLGKQIPNCPVSFRGVGIIVELQVLQPLSVRPGQSSCRLLALPQEDLSVQGSSV